MLTWKFKGVMSLCIGGGHTTTGQAIITGAKDIFIDTKNTDKLLY